MDGEVEPRPGGLTPPGQTPPPPFSVGEEMRKGD